MVEARTRSLRFRGRAAGVFAAGYVVALASFWLAGIVAYAVTEDGLAKLAGLAYFPILLLPWFGEGTVLGIDVGSDIWWWWFALQMALGAVAMWMYPYEPRRRHPARRPRLASRSGLAKSRPVARMPRV